MFFFSCRNAGQYEYTGGTVQEGADRQEFALPQQRMQVVVACKLRTDSRHIGSGIGSWATANLEAVALVLGKRVKQKLSIESFAMTLVLVCKFQNGVRVCTLLRAMKVSVPGTNSQQLDSNIKTPLLGSFDVKTLKKML